VSLVLAGLIAAGASGAVAVGRWLARRRDAAEKGAAEGETRDDRQPATTAPREPKTDAPPREQAGGEKKKPPRKVEGPHAHLEGFPCQLGDVVTRVTGEEAWLAGGVVLSEDMPVAVVFVAPEAGKDVALYVRPRPRECLYWLEPLDPGAVLVGGEPPSSVEQGGIRFDRVRRLPLRPKRIGVGAPDLGDALVLAEYVSAGAERLLVLKGASGTTRAFRGVELDESTYEVISSGRTTLE